MTQSDLFASNDDRPPFRLCDAVCAVCGIKVLTPAGSVPITIVDRLGRTEALCLPSCAASAGVWPWAGSATSQRNGA